MLRYLTILSFLVLITSKLIPPSINYLGCDNNFNIELLNEDECNKVIKGIGYPDSTISIKKKRNNTKSRRIIKARNNRKSRRI